ncbi:type VI secretion system tube protein TssD [Vibrio sp.]|uniref:type VI secretion system tube protein TssD n=1 Tax=Vibrio sp. TaxID=678 RepID=UPI003AA7BCA6
MPTPCYLSIKGATQGNITAGACTADSIGDSYVEGHEDEMLVQDVDHTVTIPTDPQSGSEQVYVHAQKDFKSETLNDYITDVNHDQHLTVESDQFTQFKNNHNLTVEGESTTYVKGDLSREVVGSIQQKVGSIHVMEAGKEVSLTSGGKLVVEAGSEVTLKVGGSFVKVDAAGVHLVGASVNINSGGSAGSASKYSAQSTMLPKGIEPVAPPQPPRPIAARSFIAAETAGVSTVKPCPLATNSSTSAVLSNETDSAKADNQEQAENILQSDLLKPSATLNQLAEGSFTAYRKGDKGAEIKLIQQALMKLGFDLGKYGADGDFGSTTERQVKAFQQNYQATHETHISYQVGQVDGIVGKGTILGLDEAVVGEWSYKVDICTEKFNRISKIIFRHEGGYVNNPNDEGGATNKGIAWNTWLKYAKSDLGIEPTLDNLKKINRRRS